MSAAGVVAQVLLWLGVLAQLLCCLGTWWLRDVFDSLHFAAAGSTVGPVLIGTAVAILGTGSVSGTVETVAACALLLAVNPLLTHATARAARRASGDGTAPDAADAPEG